MERFSDWIFDHKVMTAYLIGGAMVFLVTIYHMLCDGEVQQNIELQSTKAVNGALLRDKLAREIGE